MSAPATCEATLKNIRGECIVHPLIWSNPWTWHVTRDKLLCLCCGKGAEVSIFHSPIALWLTFYHFSESCNSVISISSQMRLHYRRCTFACLCSVDEGDLRRWNQNCIVKSIYFTKISLTEGGIKINRPENVIIFCLFRHLALDLVRSKSNWWLGSQLVQQSFCWHFLHTFMCTAHG